MVACAVGVIGHIGLGGQRSTGFIGVEQPLDPTDHESLGIDRKSRVVSASALLQLAFLPIAVLQDRRCFRRPRRGSARDADLAGPVIEHRPRAQARIEMDRKRSDLLHPARRSRRAFGPVVRVVVPQRNGRRPVGGIGDEDLGGAGRRHVHTFRTCAARGSAPASFQTKSSWHEEHARHRCHRCCSITRRTSDVEEKALTRTQHHNGTHPKRKYPIPNGSAPEWYEESIFHTVSQAPRENIAFSAEARGPILDVLK